MKCLYNKTTTLVQEIAQLGTRLPLLYHANSLTKNRVGPKIAMKTFLRFQSSFGVLVRFESYFLFNFVFRKVAVVAPELRISPDRTQDLHLCYSVPIPEGEKNH